MNAEAGGWEPRWDETAGLAFPTRWSRRRRQGATGRRSSKARAATFAVLHRPARGVGRWMIL
jgi:hypothetical protein